MRGKYVYVALTVFLAQNKLYYVALRSGPTESSKQAAHYWSVSDTMLFEGTHT